MRIIGHRGSMATHPENSIAGFRHAIDCGADGAELDVTLTRDGVLVVSHDLASEHLASDLPSPRLQHILALERPGNFIWDIEMKTASPQPLRRTTAVALAETIRHAGIRDRLWVRSFDHDALRSFHELEPLIPLIALIDDDAGDWPAIARAARAFAISPHYTAVTADRVSLAHASNIAVSVWTVNEPPDWMRFFNMSVDALITDDPAAAVRYFRNLLRSGNSSA